MKKRNEILRALNQKRKALMDMLTANNLEEAKKLGEEVETLTRQLDEAEEEKPTASLKPINGGIAMDKKEKLSAIRRAVNNFIHKGWKALDEADRTMIRPVNATDTPGQVESVEARGGVLVPVEVADFVDRIDTGVYRLRTRVANYPANTKSGVIPKIANPTAGLVQFFDEFPSGGIARGQVEFGSVKYNVGDYGLIVPVSNDLMADANADVYGVIAEQFARAQVITENAMILAAMDAATAGEEVEMTSWKDLNTALNGVAPVGGVDKVIITNVTGYSYLDNLTDTVGHPILVQDLVTNPRKRYRGYEVIELPNEVLADIAGASDSDPASTPFYVCSPRDAVYFIERKGMEISYNPYSDSAYGKNAVDIRVLCRLDCKVRWAEAVKKLLFTPKD